MGRNGIEYTKELLEPIIKESKSFIELQKKLFGNTSGGNRRNRLMRIIKDFSIDISHFTKSIKYVYTEDFIKFIQEKYDSGMSWKLIINTYDISIIGIRKFVKSGMLKSKTVKEILKSRNDKNRTLTKEDVIKIQNDYNNGLYWETVIKKYNLSRSTLGNYIKRGELISRSLEETRQLIKDNPDINKNRLKYWTPENRKKLSEAKTLLYKDHPEKHPNFKLRGHTDKLSYPEKITYRFLEARGIEFQIQEYVSGFWLDFLIIDDLGNKINIETDSEYWHKNRKEQDARRDKILTELGYHVIRIPSKTVYENLMEIFKDYNKEVVLDLKKIKQETIIIPDRKIISLCIDCGKEISKKSKRCKECYVKIPKIIKSYNRKVKLKFEVSKEELEKLLKEKYIEEIGRMFGVSGGAIKKRCLKLGVELPKKRGDWMKKIPIEKAYELYKQGKSFEQISELLDISIKRIRSGLKNHFNIKSHECKPINRDKVIELYNKGFSGMDIRRELHCSSEIYRILQDLKSKNLIK